MDVRAGIITVSGLVFLGSIITHLIVWIRMRPRPGSDFDETYYELEEQRPDYARYQKASRITFSIAVVSVLVLFTATFVF
ncbi:MAG: hypothetical protein JW828_10135 [Sedimentisphaerales bacterium]|nr:hypothetical protein [Sedimentisphaerales bacterium]